MFKMPAHEIEALDGQELQLIIEKDFMPPVIAAILKAAHLTMFDMLGYEYVFSPTGRYVADILRRFYIENKDRKNKREAVNDYFPAFSRMTFPMEGNGATMFAGTVNDRQGIMCMGAGGRPFAIGAVVKLTETETFCALLPPDNAEAIGTYVSFLKDPPREIALRNFRFIPGSETEKSHWGISTEDYRIPVPVHAN